MERSLKIGQVIVFAMVMRHRAGRVMVSRLPDVRQPTVNQREHVLSGSLVKEPPLTAHGDVDRRGVSEHASSPFIVVMTGTRLRPPAASCQPGMAVDLSRPLWRRRDAVFLTQVLPFA